MRITRETPLQRALELGSKCQRRNNCCRHGSGALAMDDEERIAAYLKITREELRQKYLEPVTRLATTLQRPKSIMAKGRPWGPCIFFRDGCAIQEVKPLECRVGTCSEDGEDLSIWFMLNFFLDMGNPESVREYASYLRYRKTIPGGKLEELIPDKKVRDAILNRETIG